MPAKIVSKALWGGPGKAQWNNIPTSLPAGQTIIIGIGGQNLGSPISLGMEWTVFKPDGSTAQHFKIFDSDSLIKTNGKYNFQGPYLNLDTEGQWKIKIELFTGGINQPEVADKYDGLLVSIVGSSSQLKGHFDKTLSRMTIGGKVSALPTKIQRGSIGQLQLWAKNDMDTNQKMTAVWTIVDPENKVRYTYPISPDGASSWTEIPAGKWAGYTSQKLTFDKDGSWSFEAKLLMNPDNPVTADSFSGEIAKVSR